MRFLIFLLLTSCSFSAAACGNENYSALTELPFANGKIDLLKLLNADESNESQIILPYWNTQVDDALKYKWDNLKKAIQTNKDYKLLSDYAWVNIKMGNVKESIVILDSLYKLYPNDYAIVANLGTANELIGNNTKALELITKAVAINPNSHYHSEWIHINILKEKIALSENFFSILQLPIDSYRYKEWINENKSDAELDSLLKAIAYQLHERMFFVKAPDKIVGQLIMDFGDLVVKRYSYIEAIPFFVKAVQYNKELEWNIQRRITVCQKLIATNKKGETSSSSNTIKNGLFLLAGILIGLIIFIFKRKV